MARSTTTGDEVCDFTTSTSERHDCDSGAPTRVAFRLLSVTFMRDQRGFSLLEVLVVVVLVGVLSALAIPQYAGFRARGFDSKVAAAVRGVATGEEAYYAENRVYATDVETLRNVSTGGVAINISAGNSGNLETSFRIVGTHPGATRTFTWLSDPLPGQPNLADD